MMDTGLLCAGIIVGLFVGLLPVLIRWQPGDGGILHRSIRRNIQTIKESLTLPDTDEHIDMADIQAHRHIARHGIEPYRSQSLKWLDRHGK